MGAGDEGWQFCIAPNTYSLFSRLSTRVYLGLAGFLPLFCRFFPGFFLAFFPGFPGLLDRSMQIDEQRK